MLRSMYSGISGMKTNQVKLDVIGNNIANVSTTGFKSSSARFSDMLYQNASEATAPTSTKGGTNAKQVGLGSQLSSINKVMGQGNALSTGRSLDVCVDGDGYIMVSKGPEVYAADKTGTGADAKNTIGISTSGKLTGGGENEILYTRDGNFTLDHEGNLLTADGYRVMGYLLKDGDDGKPSVAWGEKDGDAPVANYVDADSKNLHAVGEGAQLNTLKIPDKVLAPKRDPDGKPTAEFVEVPVKSFSIGKDGVITAVLGDGSRTALGQVAMATFKNPEGLTSIGGNLLQTSPNSGPEIIKTPVGKLATDFSDNSKGFGEFVQGALESSNVDLTEQFTDMITATRAFQASSKMITTGDEILQTITGLMR
ncbi:flagellar hook protein FlgE [Clostridium botulinum]|uniref:flagellar hook-basal body complex protein n=1 Tax=Clostridium botulinum TaxID=1491 RepID=UPI000174E426|nr:flagellar hook-basal body complex protein [Clostridium botulinum]ACD51065.1 flagellar hook protein FlgE [Clostridium botulinum E3 str. Alaska E43]AJF28838.1 flagellar hook protein FlgE [Clostridium botulinum]AJF31899.1 flagellar hook protein FlgE [Clostridium botulinum]MBY6790035.1 flagellar hook-basal body complex protein [Clostridium botulinum]MBY6817572.1 flagellar hook-basal body complex protein [Clostridium botulinum]